jgi:pyrroline-5-carboxylate reductase
VSQSTITFLGGGNMAGAIYGGLVDNGFTKSQITVIDPSESAQQQALNVGLGYVLSAAPETIDDDLLVLAVKPQIAATVLASLKGKLSTSTTVLSIIAGIDSASLAAMLGLTNTSTIIRCMPNTPSMVNEGMTALLTNDQCSESGRILAEQVMAAVGKTLWVQEESDLDIVTAISGSGPAYFFLFMESLTEAAIKLGMSSKAARLLAVQTAVGSAKLASVSDEDLAILRNNVTSPGGTTQQAILSFEQAGLRGVVDDAVSAAKKRSLELSEEFGV